MPMHTETIIVCATAIMLGALNAAVEAAIIAIRLIASGRLRRRPPSKAKAPRPKPRKSKKEGGARQP